MDSGGALGAAMPSVNNARMYWESVACECISGFSTSSASYSSQVLRGEQKRAPYFRTAFVASRKLPSRVLLTPSVLRHRIRDDGHLLVHTPGLHQHSQLWRGGRQLCPPVQYGMLGRAVTLATLRG